MPSGDIDGPRSSGLLSLLRDDAFRRVWLAGTLIGTIRWIEFLVVGVYVFEITGSALQVALMTLLRMLPMPFLSAFAGALAERLSRRGLLIGVVNCGVVVSLVQVWLAWTGELQLWHVALGATINGAFWAIDMPLRRTMLGEIAGPARTAAAMGLDAGTNNATRMLGPGVGGLLLETTGLPGAFLLGAALYVVSHVLLRGLRREAAADRGGAFRLIERIAEGVRIVRADRALVGTLIVTMIFNVFAWPATSMVPVVGEVELHLSAFPIGLLMSADGFGALLGAILVARGARPERFRAIYLMGVSTFALGSIVFALSPWPILSGIAQVAVGFGGASFATMQATIVFLSTPIAARPRVMGVLSVCIGSAVLGFLHIGLLSHWLGGAGAVLVTSIETLVALAIAARIWPEIRPSHPFAMR